LYDGPAIVFLAFNAVSIDKLVEIIREELSSQKAYAL
jgi:hypothetical protein